MRAIKDHLFLLIIILVSFIIGSATLTRGHEWGDDFASYIMQAQSILKGNTDEFIERNTFTIFQSSFQIGPIAYPWGYPLILTPALLIKGVHPLALKIPGLFFFAGFLICLYWLTKSRLTRAENLLLVSIFAFNPILTKFLDQILSDISFLFFITLGLVLISNFKPNAPPWKHFVLGAVLFYAFFVRTTGLILFASYLAYQALGFIRHSEARKTILRNSAAITLSFVLLWLVTFRIFPNGQGAYFKQLQGLTPVIFRENISIYFYLFRDFFGTGPVWTCIYYVLTVLFLIGISTRFNQDQLIAIFFMLYFVAMLFWPEHQGIRFIFSILPLFIYFVFQGIRFIIQKTPKTYQRAGEIAFHSFWILVIGFFLFISATRAYNNLKAERKINGPFDPYSSDVYNFIRAETPPDSVIVFFKPRAMRLFTDRDTIMSIDCEHMESLGDYAVISKKAENSQIPPDEIDQCNFQLKNVFENQRFIVYELPK